MLDLAMAQYGSFVARALLSDSRVNSTAALQHIADHKADVESTKHGSLGALGEAVTFFFWLSDY